MKDYNVVFNKICPVCGGDMSNKNTFCSLSCFNKNKEGV